MTSQGISWPPILNIKRILRFAKGHTDIGPVSAMHLHLLDFLNKSSLIKLFYKVKQMYRCKTACLLDKQASYLYLF